MSLIQRFHWVFVVCLQADLAFKQEEKEKSEATAKSLDSGPPPPFVPFPSLPFFSLPSFCPLLIPPFLLPVNFNGNCMYDCST